MTKAATHPQRNGDCFEFHYREFAFGFYPDDARLVHGVVTNALDGLPMSHAWIELDDGASVIDGSNGRVPVRIDRRVYYSIGNVVDEPGKLHRYTKHEALVNGARFGHYGSWELECER